MYVPQEKRNAAMLAYSRKPYVPYPQTSRHYKPISLLILQTIPHTFPYPLLKLRRIISPQRRGLDIRWRLVIRTRQHADDREENRFGCLHRGPALRRGFVAVFVFLGGVQDRDAYFAVLVDWVV
jgi:hypothetical protein